MNVIKICSRSTVPSAAGEIVVAGGRPTAAAGFACVVPCDIDCVGKQSCVLCGRVITSRSSAAAAAAITKQTCVMRARACRRHSRPTAARSANTRSAENAPAAASIPEVGQRGPRVSAQSS